jgi:hypothetical protein
MEHKNSDPLQKCVGGEGRMMILTSEPSTHIGIRLEFIKPFASTAQNDFQLAPVRAPSSAL